MGMTKIITILYTDTTKMDISSSSGVSTPIPSDLKNLALNTHCCTVGHVPTHLFLNTFLPPKPGRKSRRKAVCDHLPAEKDDESFVSCTYIRYVLSHLFV